MARKQSVALQHREQSRSTISSPVGSSVALIDIAAIMGNNAEVLPGRVEN